MLLLTTFLSIFLFTVLATAVRKLISVLRGDSPLAAIPGPPSSSYLKGHMDQLFDSKNGPQFHLDLINNYDRISKVKGFLGDEQLYISDPLALQSIIVKDQDNYEETTVFIENNKIIFGEGLVATIGDHHRKQRRLINPVFSLHRLRNLVPTFYKVAHRLQTAIIVTMNEKRRLRARNDETMHGQDVWSTDMAEWLSRAALESIGQAGLGYSFDPLNSLSTNPYTKTVRALIPTMFRIAPLRLLTPFATRLGPPRFRRFLLDLVPIRAVQLLKQMSDQMDRTCREILRAKRTAHASKSGLSDQDDTIFANGNGDERDIMSVLLRANEAADSKEKLSEAELLGQMNVLIFGAQDTTASALSRVLYLLSRQEHIGLQERLRKEILQAYEERDGRDLHYDELSNLPLLDAVLKETLRLYPPVPFVRRVSRQQTVLPFSRPVLLSDGHSSVSSIVVPKGTTIWVSITGANRSKNIWGDDADEWKPERWLNVGSKGQCVSRDSVEKGKLKLPGLYSGMLTFFGGGRSCVGYRFALIEMKVILVTLLSSFRFLATDDRIVWNLSQILSPSFTNAVREGIEQQGMPIGIEPLS